MAVRLTLQRALLGTIAAALLVGIVPAAVALDRRLVAALIAKARSDLAMAPGVLADRMAARADVLRMHAQEFARAPGLAAALSRNDTLGVRRIADLAKPQIDNEPLVIATDGGALVGELARDDWLAEARRGRTPVGTTVEHGTVFSVAIVPVRVDGRYAGAAGLIEPIDEAAVDALARLTRSDVTVLAGDSVILSTLDSTQIAGLRSVLGHDSVTADAGEYRVGSGVLFAVAAPLDNSVRVVFSRWRDAELAVVPELHRVAVVSAVVALGIALLLGALMAARVTRPARELSAAAMAMARGSFDAPLPRSRIAEISSVAEQFGEMRRALERQVRELQLSNDALEDRTARLVALQADLMQRERLAATGRLVAHLAHEIRNPIANLRNLLELMRRRVAGDPFTRDYADLAIDELLRMHELAEQMLDLNRPRDPDAQRCDPLAVVRDVARLAMAGAGDDALEMDVVGDEGLAAAIAPDALKQVLLNLVQNAREAATQPARATPRVVIDVRASPDGVRIGVEDNGPGVPRELRTRIFDPFFTTKGAVDGVGLGLFVAEGLVRSAGGRLAVHSASIGGARFVVELPHAKAIVPSPPAGEGAQTTT